MLLSTTNLTKFEGRRCIKLVLYWFRTVDLDQRELWKKIICDLKGLCSITMGPAGFAHMSRCGCNVLIFGTKFIGSRSSICHNPGLKSIDGTATTAAAAAEALDAIPPPAMLLWRAENERLEHAEETRREHAFRVARPE